MSRQCRNVCVYKNCTNRRGDDGIILFCFPKKNTEKFNLWCHNAGLDTAATQWRMMICNAHFRGKDFTTHERQKLLPQAVPIDFTQLDNSNLPPFNPANVQRNYGGNLSRAMASFENMFVMSDEPVANSNLELRIPDPPHVQVYRTDDTLPPQEDTPEPESDRVVKLEAEVERLQSMVSKVSQQLSEIRKKTVNRDSQGLRGEQETNVETLFNVENIKNDTRRTMVELQLRSDNCTSSYSDDQKTLASKIHYWSPSAYEKMRQSGLQLPHSRTVEKWVAETDVTPGIIKLSYKDLEKDLKNLPPEAKHCIVKWGKMPCREFEEYSSKHDEIEGFEDLGPLGRNSNRANHVLVFTLNGLHSSYRWRVLLAYFFVRNELSGDKIVSLLKMLIDKAEKIGADVRMTVCDGGPPNVQCYKLLNASLEKPSCLLNGKKIINIYDFSHEVKNFVITLLKYKEIYMNGKVLYLSDMIATLEANKKFKFFNNLCHLSESHIFPDRLHKLDVVQARHLLGDKLAIAMIEAHEKGLVNSSTILETAECIQIMNAIIDTAESNKIRDKDPLRSALSVQNVKTRKVLEDFLSWASTLKVLDKKNRMKSMPCFQGLEMSIRGLLELFNDLSAKMPNFQLCTKLCTQDSVEQLLFRFHGRRGFNTYPTCRMLRLTIRHMLLLKHSIADSRRGSITEKNDDGVGYEQITAEELKQQVKNLLLADEVRAASAISYIEDGRYCKDNVLNDNLKCHSYKNNSIIGIDVFSDDEDESGNENDIVRNENSQIQVVDEYLSIRSDHFLSGLYQFEKLDSVLPSQMFSGDSILYFGGYIANAAIEKWECDRCNELLLEPPEAEEDQDDTSIACREYESESSYKVIVIRKPSAKFREIVATSLLSLLNVVRRERYQCKIRQLIEERAIHDSSQVHFDWYSKSDPCYEHKLFAIRCLIKAKLHRVCTIDNREAKAISLHERRSDTTNKRKKTSQEKGKPSRRLKSGTN